MKTLAALLALLLSGSFAHANSFNWPPVTGSGGGGSTGATGATGANGSGGAAGASGATGATGSNGSTGAAGATGATGANGSAGAAGATGASGSNGSAGAAGASGASGATGATGALGTPAAIGSSPNANAMTLSGTTLNLEPASASFGGVVTTGTQSYAGAKTETGAWTASAAGAASVPGVLISGAPFTGGSATTTKPQLNVDSGTSTAWSTSGTVIGANAPSGFAGNLLDVQKNGSTRASITSAGVFNLTDGTENYAFTAAPIFSINNSTHASSTFFTFRQTTGYLCLGIGTCGNDWYLAVTNTSSDTAPLTNLTPNTGTPSILNLRNSNSTANNYESIVFSGSTDKATSFIYGVNTVHTAASETGEIHFGTNDAGTKKDGFVLRAKGQITYVGTAPAAGTCGTSPGTPVGNDNVFKITSGTGGSSGSCAVTLATTPTTGGHCDCMDETNAATFVVSAVVSSATVTMTTYNRTTGVAANFTASDVFSCSCGFY